MLGLTFLSTILDLTTNYKDVYYYLPDLFGYSLITNLFMLSVYFNKAYCSATKIAVLGLAFMNVFSLVCISFNFYSICYNLAIELVIILVVCNLLIDKK